MPIEQLSPPEGAVRRARIGLLTPYKELPGEYDDVIADCPAPTVAWQVVTQAADSHDPDDLRVTGSADPLVDGLRRLERWHPDLVMWACTSGSFILGREGSVEQCELLSARAGVNVRSTSIAFVAALRALDVREVALCSPYPRPATQALVQYLAAWGIGVADMVHLNHASATSSEGIVAADIQPLLQRLKGAELVMIPDTATWGFELWGHLADASKRPIITANQVTLWLAFELLALPTSDTRFGALRDVRANDPVAEPSDRHSNTVHVTSGAYP